MIIVQVERPGDTRLADWFAELRLWFDDNDCSPMLFTEVGRHYNTKFADEAEARLFASTFAKYGAVNRHPFAEPSEVQEDPI